MSKFENRFKLMIEKDISDDELAMAETLDPDTEMSEFDIEPTPDPSEETGIDGDLTQRVAQANADHARAMTESITNWIGDFEGFLQLLNGTDPDSIQSKLASAEPDTILDKMKQSEQRKIARVATELAALTESFKGYLAQTTNSSLKYV